jgi:hypothetical protein
LRISDIGRMSCTIEELLKKVAVSEQSGVLAGKLAQSQALS